jgi:2-methylisocitrate lyase-like PEP mutase family enzyme
MWIPGRKCHQCRLGNGTPDWHGLAGMNIEDQASETLWASGGKTPSRRKKWPVSQSMCRSKQPRQVIINARTDAYAVAGIEEAIRRCNLYFEAGADLVFIDGIGTLAEIEKATQAIHGPLSINLMDAVTGVKTQLIPVPELARLGVARVSIPVASILVAHQALMTFQSLKASPEDSWRARPIGYPLSRLHGFRRSARIPSKRRVLPRINWIRIPAREEEPSC